MATENKLKLLFGGALVEQLGAQLYPSATATVAELISNAWDADAKNVWVTMPLEESWNADSEIVVIDDGTGMTRDDAQRAYLIVGRKRRLEDKGLSPGGRLVHGRKGIGKLAAFGTAGVLECTTRKEGEQTSFKLDYERIRKLKPAEDYEVEDIDQQEPLVDPSGSEIAHGTRIRLTRLHLKRALTEEQFMQSMSRRFSIAQTEMKVSINGKGLSRFDIQVEVRFPADGIPSDKVSVAADGWAEEELEPGRPVRWWIGFTKTPLKEEALQGVSILARGKMAQRPFKFERAQGTTGQLGQEYLVGEVVADWLDTGVDIEDDLIQSNRDQLQLEDARLDPLLEWGRERLGWALRERNRIRSERSLAAFEISPKLETILQPFTKTERKRFLRVAQVAAKIPEIDAQALEGLMEGVVTAQSDATVREMMDQIHAEDESVQERMWALVHEFGLIDARRTLSLIEARLTTIDKLKGAIATGAKEVPDIHNIVREDAWLLDPRWHLYDDEVDIGTLGVSFEPETDSESGDQLDFLFVLQPHSPATVDDVIVIEIKRGTNKDGKVRKADESEVEKFHGYVLAIEEHYSKNTNPPRIRGLMIAQDYTAKANLKRKSLERIGVPKMEFKTWDRVIEETERMHLGWLEVSKRRLAGTQSIETPPVESSEK
jgi:hypothetical protein